MSDKKYAVCPGYVRSKNDGQRHHISFGRLCELYGVAPRECFDMSDHPAIAAAGLIVLEPRHDGKYRLPQGGEGSEGDE